MKQMMYLRYLCNVLYYYGLHVYVYAYAVRTCMRNVYAHAALLRTACVRMRTCMRHVDGHRMRIRYERGRGRTTDAGADGCGGGRGRGRTARTHMR
jgi:hypothetical protein